MPKINIKVSLKNNDNDISNSITAIYQDNIIRYKEDEKTKVSFNYDNNILKRENDEFRMLFDFNKSIINIDYKELHSNIDMHIKVNKLIKKNRDVKIEYELSKTDDKNKTIYRIEEIK